MCTQYLAMIVRSCAIKIKGFPVYLSQEQEDACRHLLMEAADGRDLIDPLQALGWALLTTSPQEVLANDRLCPIRRFLVAYFIKENGVFVPVQYMSTDASKVLIIFRGFGSYRIAQRVSAGEMDYFQ